MRKKLAVFLSILMVFTFIVTFIGETGFAQEDDRVVEVSLITRPKSSSPDEFETMTILAEAMKNVGIDATVEVMPWEKMADVVWYDREAWQITGWQMTARPERLDPDEFTYNLFHSSTAETG